VIKKIKVEYHDKQHFSIQKAVKQIKNKFFFKMNRLKDKFTKLKREINSIKIKNISTKNIQAFE
jgi:hypothetical protein